jgi:hypothetical protein
MKPSDINPFRFSPLPFIDLLGKAELEVALASIVLFLKDNGDEWRSFTTQQLTEWGVVQITQRTFIGQCLSNPFLRLVHSADLGKHLKACGPDTVEVRPETIEILRNSPFNAGSGAGQGWQRSSSLMGSRRVRDVRLCSCCMEASMSEGLECKETCSLAKGFDAALKKLAEKYVISEAALKEAREAFAESASAARLELEDKNRLIKTVAQLESDYVNVAAQLGREQQNHEATKSDLYDAKQKLSSVLEIVAISDSQPNPLFRILQVVMNVVDAKKE